MRESIGTISLLNFVIFFILLVFAFLMGTFSYYKAYRVNNDIVKAIEKFEGYNDLSKDEIEDKLNSLGYNRVPFKCPNNRKSSDGYTLVAGDSVDSTIGLVDNKDWICIYHKVDTYEKTANGVLNETDQYYSYEVMTVITFKFPVLESLLKLHVSARTRRMYDFKGSFEAVH